MILKQIFLLVICWIFTWNIVIAQSVINLSAQYPVPDYQVRLVRL